MNEKDKKDKLVLLNQELYSSVCQALIQAAQMLGVKGELKFGIFSHRLNQKIPGDMLRSALYKGGAISVITDKYRYKVHVGSNDGVDEIRQRTNFHLAILKS